MTIKDTLTAHLKEAMLAKEEVRVSTLRLLRGEIKNNEIAKGELSEKDILQIIRKEIKKRQDAISMYETHGNDKRALQEKEEVGILESYLPAAPSSEAVKNFIANEMTQYPEIGGKEKGMIIKKTTEHFEGTVDGGFISGILNSLM